MQGPVHDADAVEISRTNDDIRLGGRRSQRREVLGNAAHHVWVGGLLTLVAGVAFALVGDFGGRRFTTWAGGVFAAFGVYLFAGDVTNFQKSFNSFDPNIARPAWITIGFGIGLVCQYVRESISVRRRFITSR